MGISLGKTDDGANRPAGPRFPSMKNGYTRAKVEFIVIGGVAGIVHGAATFTKDLDIVYARNAENLSRLVAAIAPHGREVPLRDPPEAYSVEARRRPAA